MAKTPLSKGEAAAPFLEALPAKIAAAVEAKAGPKPEELKVEEKPLPQDEEAHSEVELRDQVILNGRKYGPGKCRIPTAAFDVWKNVLKR